MSGLYDPGTQVRLSVLFEREGRAADPTAVSCKVRSPSGAVVTYDYPASVARDGVGRYRLDLIPPSPGTWHYKWVATGEVSVQAEGNFRVREQVIP